jgi:Ca-activated chloride channel family protein
MESLQLQIDLSQQDRELRMTAMHRSAAHPAMRTVAAVVVALMTMGSGLIAGTSSARAADDRSEGKLLLMLDASGSMNEPDPSGVSKLAAAQKALTSVVDSLPDTAVVGLRVYGATVNAPNPTAQSCADSQLVAPVAPIDRTALKAAITKFTAVGDTPIA